MLLNDSVCISVGDKSALRPSGLRFGSPALTSRGLVQDDFKKVAEFIHRGNPQHYCCCDICALTWCGCMVFKISGTSSYYLTFVYRYCPDLGGAGKPWSQGSSERLHSSAEAGRQVPAAGSRNQNRRGRICKSIPNARFTWIVKCPTRRLWNRWLFD